MLGRSCERVVALAEGRGPKVLQEALSGDWADAGRSSNATPAAAACISRWTSTRAAALALARHQPEAALKAIPVQLRLEVKTARAHYEDYMKRGQPHLSKDETAQDHRLLPLRDEDGQAISMLKGTGAIQALEEEVASARRRFFPDEWPCRIFSALGSPRCRSDGG